MNPITFGTAVVTLVLTSIAAAGLDDTTPPAPPPAAVDTAPAPAPDPVLLALLDEVEKSGSEVRSFAASVTMVSEEPKDFGRGKTTRTGKLIFRTSDTPTESHPRKMLAVLFDSVISGNRKREQRHYYIVGGRWLAEIDPEQKLFIRRDIAPEGAADFDPFDLRHGIVPLPVGQKRQAVLERFDVSAIALPESGALAKLAERGVDGIHLVPRPGSGSDTEYQSVDIFFDRASRLPVGVRATEKNGNIQSLRLDDVVVNPTIDEETLAGMSMAVPDPRSWTIDIR